MEAMEPKTATSARQWKQKSGAVDFPVPSGNVCKVRKRALSAFLQQGKIPNGMMPMVEAAIATGSQPSEEEILKNVTKDPKMLNELLDLVDSAVVECVIEPDVQPVPVCEQCGKLTHKGDENHPINIPDRDDDTLYVDEVDLTDKIAIFAFVTSGVKDLESFLEQPSPDVPAAPDESGLQPATQ